MLELLKKRPNLLSILALVIILSSFLILFRIRWGPFIFSDSYWRDQTSPLTTEQRIDICNKLGLPIGDSRCVDNAIVYGPDFYPAIQKWLDKQENEEVTYQQIDELLGDYLYQCRPYPPEEIGKEAISCYFDLRGDIEYVYVTRFDENGRLIDHGFNLED